MSIRESIEDILKFEQATTNYPKLYMFVDIDYEIVLIRVSEALHDNIVDKNYDVRKFLEDDNKSLWKFQQTSYYLHYGLVDDVPEHHVMKTWLQLSDKILKLNSLDESDYEEIKNLKEEYDELDPFLYSLYDCHNTEHVEAFINKAEEYGTFLRV